MIDSAEINCFRILSRKLRGKTGLQQRSVAGEAGGWLEKVKREATRRLVYWLHNEV